MGRAFIVHPILRPSIRSNLNFLANLYADIESLRLYGGIHLKPYKNYHRLLSKKFPFAVFYTVMDKTVFIHAIVDCRRDPAWLRKRLDRTP